jgi:hypothetical protein
VKKMGLDEVFDPGEDGVPGTVDVGGHPGQLGQHDRGRVGPHDSDSLLVQGVENFAGEAFAHPRRMLCQPVSQSGAGRHGGELRGAAKSATGPTLPGGPGADQRTGSRTGGF